jgi:mannose-1-phosphate guanylyltransferase/mannose-6-phosphate isomerase
MSGGSGTRLWPLSTDARPKQFHALASQGTMIQETAQRLTGAHGDIAFTAPIIIGNAAQSDIIEQQLGAIGVEPAEIILEPIGRNTAATAALAALAAQALDRDALVLLVPADHVIADATAFLDAIARAAPFAHERIVTFGIVPTRPETGYGYIQAGEPLGEGVDTIARFKEKPNAQTAADYLAQGGFYWNAGIFLFSPAVLLAEFKDAAAIRDATAYAYETADRAGRFVRLGSAFHDVPSAPVDIAVMEKTARGAVAPCDIGWADIGSWFELWRLEAADAASTVTKGDVIALDCAGSLIHADGIVVAASGLQDMIVVATKDVVLILPKSRAQDVKALCEAAKAKR